MHSATRWSMNSLLLVFALLLPGGASAQYFFHLAVSSSSAWCDTSNGPYYPVGTLTRTWNLPAQPGPPFSVAANTWWTINGVAQPVTPVGLTEPTLSGSNFSTLTGGLFLPPPAGPLSSGGYTAVYTNAIYSNGIPLTNVRVTFLCGTVLPVPATINPSIDPPNATMTIANDDVLTAGIPALSPRGLLFLTALLGLATLLSAHLRMRRAGPLTPR